MSDLISERSRKTRTMPNTFPGSIEFFCQKQKKLAHISIARLVSLKSRHPTTAHVSRIGENTHKMVLARFSCFFQDFKNKTEFKDLVRRCCSMFAVKSNTHFDADL